MIVWEITDRGFMRGEFLGGRQKWVVQELPLSGEDAIVLGWDDGEMRVRATVTRSIAEKIIGVLEGFVETGNLRKGRDYE